MKQSYLENLTRKMSVSHQKHGNENSYTPEFFESLYKKISLTDKHLQKRLEKAIILAAQSYMRNFDSNHRQLAPYAIKKELEKTINHLDKGADALINVIASGNYGPEIANNLYAVISDKYPILSSALPHLKTEFKTSPAQSLIILQAIKDGLESTLENAESPDKTSRSTALKQWIMILSAQLEPTIDRKLEQTHYYDGEYISKKETSDSELLLFIIRQLDRNVTMSQMETAIKYTRKERYEAPWDDYFPY